MIDRKNCVFIEEKLNSKKLKKKIILFQKEENIKRKTFYHPISSSLTLCCHLVVKKIDVFLPKCKNNHLLVRPSGGDFFSDQNFQLEPKQKTLVRPVGLHSLGCSQRNVSDLLTLPVCVCACAYVRVCVRCASPRISSR